MRTRELTLTTHSSPTPLSYRRCVNGKNLGFDNYRLTISASVTCSARGVTLAPARPVSPASLISCPLVAAHATNFGRVRTSLLRQQGPAPTGFVTAAFSPRPLALQDSDFRAQDSKLSKNKSRNIALLRIATSVPCRLPCSFRNRLIGEWRIARVFAQKRGEVFSEFTPGLRHSNSQISQ